MSILMPKAYLELAEERVVTRWDNYAQPEDYGYDFRAWVSPYTKGAHALGNVAIVLQDWSSTDDLAAGVDPESQRLGRTTSLKTNKTLENLLQRIFGLCINDTYGTNVFPFIKRGNISSYIPIKDVKKAADQFIRRELEIVEPKIILALGKLAHTGLESIGVEHVSLPHPAARIGSVSRHEEIWRDRLKIRN